MSIKSRLGSLIITGVIVMSIVFWYVLKEPYSTELVVHSLWDKFEVQSTSVGDTVPIISIDVFDKNDIPEVEKYLKSKLSKEDLEHYRIEVFSLWS